MPAQCDPFQDKAPLIGTLGRRSTVGVPVGDVTVGGKKPIVVQSMTNTDTADVEKTVEQVAALARAGSELVRITVDRDEAAAAVAHGQIAGAVLVTDGQVHDADRLADFPGPVHSLIAGEPTFPTRPVLKQYGSLAMLTASGSGVDTEVFPDPMGQNMMRRP